MSTGAIVAIVVIVLVVVALLAVFAVANRRRRLRERFGPEYDRAVTTHDSKRQAEAELAERERRVRGLNIRPLSATARARYSSEWTAVQEQFVDAPQAAVTGAQTLITAVMKDRGYPTEGYDQTVADLSVEHASTLDRFRTAHDSSQRAAAGRASTEELRQAMVDYRALFAELLGEPARDQGTPATPATPAPGEREPAAGEVREPSPGRVPERAAGDAPPSPDAEAPATVDGGPDERTATREGVDPAAESPVASRSPKR
jgi:Tfp pilus assembly protein PilX